MLLGAKAESFIVKDTTLSSFFLHNRIQTFFMFSLHKYSYKLLNVRTIQTWKNLGFAPQVVLFCQGFCCLVRFILKDYLFWFMSAPLCEKDWISWCWNWFILLIKTYFTLNSRLLKLMFPLTCINIHSTNSICVSPINKHSPHSHLRSIFLFISLSQTFPEFKTNGFCTICELCVHSLQNTQYCNIL